MPEFDEEVEYVYRLGDDQSQVKRRREPAAQENEISQDSVESLRLVIAVINRFV
jgi:hypothetical protein